jgi:hypothetical protein
MRLRAGAQKPWRTDAAHWATSISIGEVAPGGRINRERAIAARPARPLKLAGNTGNGCVFLKAGFIMVRYIFIFQFLNPVTPDFVSNMFDQDDQALQLRYGLILVLI